MKRVGDIVSSVLGLIVLLPMLVLIGILIWTTIGRPILFGQVRPGLNGEPFYLFKLRTMRSGNEPDNERLTGLGRLLRSTSIDELPELWNVLRGDMSLVGPRPLLMEYLPLYNERQRRRHEVRPGITGWAQVNGRNSLSWEEKFELDVWYVDNQSFWLDIKILLLTVKKVLAREGISAAGEATMPRFRGSKKGGEG